MAITPKYKNKKVVIDNISFASQLEGNVYKKCKELGIPFSLQPRFILMDKFKLNSKAFRAIEYVGDFAISINGNTYIIDTKGIETPIFKLKKKLYAYRYQEEIICIKSVKQFVEWWNNEKR